MIIRCSKCGSAVEYDSSLGKMKCNYCESVMEITETEYDKNVYEKNMMSCNVYGCTACGAKLVVNDVECATFCAYCGQPAIVFERVSNIYKPDRIIPFKISKEKAINIIRKRLQEGHFIPRKIKNFTLEHVNGIYVPFWLYDVCCNINYTVSTGSGENQIFSRQNKTTNFKGISIDASSNFCDVSSQRLEPFKINDLVKFEEAYLSGFYADCYDQKSSDATMIHRVIKRCKELLVEESSSDTSSDSTVYGHYPKWKILKQRYALLPVWFMTIRYKKRPFTILVNGQTGKIVGSLPYSKIKLFGSFLLSWLFYLCFIPFLCYLSFLLFNLDNSGDGLIIPAMGWLILTGALIIFSINEYKAYRKHVKQASDKTIINYSHNRQERKE